MSSRKVKGSAAVCWRFTNSPVTSSNVGGRSPRHRGDAMPFGRPPKPPLALAIRFIDDAMELAYMYLRDVKHMETEEEFEQLDILVALLSVNSEIAKFISRKMRRRLRKERK